MRAVYVREFDDADPLRVLEIGELPDRRPVPDWVPVQVKAGSLNHHDIWSLRGVGLAADALPMILGCDAAGIGPDGAQVVVHSVIADPNLPDETLDPRRSLLSERYPGTLADRVWVPARNLIPKPAELSFAEAACLPTAWLTAFVMLTRKAQVGPGSTVLVQGAGGGVATAAILLARTLGARVYATSRSLAKRDRATELGAIAVEPGGRLPERVDAVIETVGAATFEHSLKSTAPGGRIVVCGSTSGHLAQIDLRRVFFLQLQVLGSTMGTRADLVELLDLCVRTGIRPLVDSVLPFEQARAAFARLASGDTFGKVVLDHT